VREAEREDRGPQGESPQRLELPSQRGAGGAGGVVHDGEDDNQRDGQQARAQGEEPSPPQVQRD
jgi:hypothetical protein